MMFRSKDYMNQEQRTIAEDFIKMIETEYALCVQEIKRANSAIILSSPTPSNEENNINLDFVAKKILSEDDIHLDLANREINSISKYWQTRLGNLIEFIETKNFKLNEELSSKYLVNR